MSARSLPLIRTALPILLVGFGLGATSTAVESPNDDESPVARGSNDDKKNDDEKKVLPTVAKATEGMERRSGLLDLYLDLDRGRVFALLPAADPDTQVSIELIHASGLAAGLGSNPIGLDRGQIGDGELLRVLRIGRQVLLERPNLAFRATSDNPLEHRAVAQSFAGSVVWGCEVHAEDPGGGYLIDMTQYLLADGHGVTATLRDQAQGTYKIDRSRSTVDPARCKAFPRNIELEARLTFTTDGKPGSNVADTAPDATAFTLTQHHTFVALPEKGYSPRDAHPRSGYSTISFQDYAAPLAGDIHRNLLIRHRLQKTDPTQLRSRARRPIVYYVDAGAPPEIQEALIEGASWWRAAFDAAGFPDSFRVEVLPDDVDPMDARYHVIHWVHRSTRGWSYGGSIHDPRTGEILKGNVLLGSLRVRQDRLLFEGLLGAEETGSGSRNDPVVLALSRVRQLAAHEVGHTLGLSHNFIASTYGGRASVMDYPAPLVTLREDGSLDASDAYATGLGAWDMHVIRNGYETPRPGEREDQLLARLLEDADRQGLRFLTDMDTRPAGAAHPLSNLWDNGADPVAELGRLLDVRATAIENFSSRNLPAEMSLARLQESFAPVYLHHRYQIDAAAKSLGGVLYSYAMQGDADAAARPVAGAEQRAALDALLRCLTPEVLDIPETVRARLLPRTPSHPGRTERFVGRTQMVFDPLGAAEAAADRVLSAMLERHRAARLVEQHRHDLNLPGIDEVLGRLLDLALAPESRDTDARELQRVVRYLAITHVARLALDADASPAVRAAADHALVRAHAQLREGNDPAVWLAAQIELWRDHKGVPAKRGGPELPPGDPIGCGDDPMTFAANRNFAPPTSDGAPVGPR